MSGGIIGALVLQLAKVLVAYLVFRSRWFEKAVEGEAKVLVCGGGI